MKLFISYPSDQRELAEHLRLALEAEGHEVFTDRSELKEGEPYHEALREAIDDADAMVFIVTPRAVAKGSYALTELDLAERRWRSPGGHVLPVVVETTPIAAIPPYLRSVTLLQPQGDVVAETVAAVDRMRSRWPFGGWPVVLGALAVLLALGAGGTWYVRQHQAELARAQAQRERESAELAAASQLCGSGSHAVGWDQFALIVAARPDDGAARRAREDCGMQWLREMRAVAEKETFSAQVAKIQPVLAQGLAGATGERRADLRAHLGWAEFLRSRDGVAAADPLPHYQAALADDAANVYAHGMWAHYKVWTSGRLEAEAKQHYAAAAGSPRDRTWLRGMQFASAFQHGGLYVYAMVVANDMRLKNETPSPAQRDRLWRYLIDRSFYQARDRDEMFAALPAAELAATFAWLFPVGGMTAERLPLHRFVTAVLTLQGGDRAGARLQLEALRRDLGKDDDSRVGRAANQLLTELRQMR